MSKGLDSIVCNNNIVVKKIMTVFLLQAILVVIWAKNSFRQISYAYVDSSFVNKNCVFICVNTVVFIGVYLGYSMFLFPLIFSSASSTFVFVICFFVTVHRLVRSESASFANLFNSAYFPYPSPKQFLYVLQSLPASGVSSVTEWINNAYLKINSISVSFS